MDYAKGALTGDWADVWGAAAPREAVAKSE